MRKMRDRHKKSLDRTIVILRMHLDRQKVPKYRREFERDVRHLEQIRSYIVEQMKAPTFDHIDESVCELAV